MDLSSKKVFDLLASKGIEKLYHANSVLTSCHFLRDAHLASRGTVNSLGIPQTPQYSDPLDRRFSVWFDVFTDTVDIHQRALRKNSYGPVLFVLDSEKLRNEVTGRIWVTKKNPTEWASLKGPERWFQSIDELEKDLVRGRFEQMIVFRHCGGRLPIRKALKEIILDDPSIHYTSSKIDFLSLAYGALTLAMIQGNLDVPIKKRNCIAQCKCGNEYNSDLDGAEQMFVPQFK
jgi:hypothetical protein